jgi:hypothetical protein
MEARTSYFQPSLLTSPASISAPRGRVPEPTDSG